MHGKSPGNTLGWLNSSNRAAEQLDDSEAAVMYDEDRDSSSDPLSWGPRSFVDPRTYLIPPEGKDRAEIHSRIRKYIQSQAYKDRVKRIMDSNLTGLVIPAGGLRYTTNLLVTLKASRGGSPMHAMT